MKSDIFREKPLRPEGLEIIQSRLQQTCDFFIFETQVFEVYKNPIVAIIPIKQLIFKNKKSHVKKLNCFQHFVNISTDSKSSTIKFF